MRLYELLRAARRRDGARFACRGWCALPRRSEACTPAAFGAGLLLAAGLWGASAAITQALPSGVIGVGAVLLGLAVGCLTWLEFFSEPGALPRHALSTRRFYALPPAAAEAALRASERGAASSCCPDPHAAVMEALDAQAAAAEAAQAGDVAAAAAAGAGYPRDAMPLGAYLRQALALTGGAVFAPVAGSSSSSDGPLKLCPTCLILRPPRAHHCSGCDACVSEFDHHCALLGKCVGRDNVAVFISFIWAAALALWYVFASSLATIVLVARAASAAARHATSGTDAPPPWWQDDTQAALWIVGSICGLFVIIAVCMDRRCNVFTCRALTACGLVPLVGVASVVLLIAAFARGLPGGGGEKLLPALLLQPSTLCAAAAATGFAVNQTLATVRGDTVKERLRRDAAAATGSGGVGSAAAAAAPLPQRFAATKQPRLQPRASIAALLAAWARSSSTVVPPVATAAAEAAKPSGTAPCSLPPLVSPSVSEPAEPAVASAAPCLFPPLVPAPAAVAPASAAPADASDSAAPAPCLLPPIVPPSAAAPAAPAPAAAPPAAASSSSSRRADIVLAEPTLHALLARTDLFPATLKGYSGAPVAAEVAAALQRLQTAAAGAAVPAGLTVCPILVHYDAKSCSDACWQQGAVAAVVTQIDAV